MLQAQLFNTESIIPPWRRYQVRLALFAPITAVVIRGFRAFCLVFVVFLWLGVRSKGLGSARVGDKHQEPPLRDHRRLWSILLTGAF